MLESSVSATRLAVKRKSLLICVLVLIASAIISYHPSVLLLIGTIGTLAFLAIMRWPQAGLLLVIPAALLLPVAVRTGTEVNLNAAALLIPVLLLISLICLVRRGGLKIAGSSMNLPLAFFIAANLFSLLVGRATWDPKVPIPSHFILVQLAQWAVFALSGAAFWLTANLIADELWLSRLTRLFIVVAGSVAILLTVPAVSVVVDRFTTLAFIRAPLWIVLCGLAGGQLLFGRNLSRLWSLFLVLVLFASIWHSFVQFQDAVSHWLGVLVVLGTLFWLRFPRLRALILLVIVVALALGVLWPVAYNFAGGDSEWTLSGGSRIALAQRVIDVTLRNPITGLGPAAYRPYARMTPLPYSGAYWLEPQISSHNNYIDLFAHGGILSLTLFAWFAFELGRSAIRLRRRLPDGFAGAYISGVLAIGAASLVVMAFADWVLPFVYNIGYDGFQASVLVWLFSGGLISLERAYEVHPLSAKALPARQGV